MPSPRIIRSLPEFRKYRRTLSGKIGVVPTMGALHEGHASLLRKNRELCDTSVATIFVNPAQFAPHEDLDQYPRTFENDLALCEREKVDVVFAPVATDLYPHGYSTFVEETVLSRDLCGKFRPQFFRGVSTIVLKLFHLIEPQLAVFGLKDAQQFFVVSKMVEDLNLDIEILGAPTIREHDGLALSSRNVYLSVENRTLAPALYQSLKIIQEELLKKDSPKTLKTILQTEKDSLCSAGFDVQYLDCHEVPSMKLVNSETMDQSGSYLVAIAAFLGGTRLIDNLILNQKNLPRILE